jgi:hypothetical protein
MRQELTHPFHDRELLEVDRGFPSELRPEDRVLIHVRRDRGTPSINPPSESNATGRPDYRTRASSRNDLLFPVGNPSITVLEAHDIVFAEIATGLNFDHDQLLITNILKPVLRPGGNIS